MKTRSVLAMILALIMVFTLVLPVNATTQVQPISHNEFEIMQIYNAVLEGTFAARTDIQAQYLGNVDGLYHVVEITELLMHRESRSGDLFEEFSTTRIGVIQDRFTGGSTHDGSFGLIVTANMRWQSQTNGRETAARLVSFDVSARPQDSQHILTRLHGGYGQNGAVVAGLPFQSEFRTFSTTAFSLHRNTGFTGWVGIDGFGIGLVVVNIDVDFIQRGQPRSLFFQLIAQ